MLDSSNETIKNYSQWHFYLYLHGQMMVNKSTYCFASVSVSQKKNQLLKFIDQTIRNFKFEFSDRHRIMGKYFPPKKDK